MDVASLILSVLGVLLSWHAVRKSASAHEMARKVIERLNENADSTRLRGVLEKLRSAKEVALRRQSGASIAASRGVRGRDDLMTLRVAQDALRTELPLTMPQAARDTATNAAHDMAAAIQTIEVPTGPRDGWKDALATLQVVIPEMEREERRLNTRNVLGMDS